MRKSQYVTEGVPTEALSGTVEKRLQNRKATMTAWLRAFAGAIVAVSLITAGPTHALTATDVNLPADKIQRSLACIGILGVSISYTDDGTPMGYDREDMADTAGVWAMWVSSMTGLTTDQVYQRAEVEKYADAFAANRTNAAAQLRFCMTELPT